MDAFYRFNDTTPHRMGTPGIIHLGFTGWEHRAFQFRTGTGGTGETRSAPDSLSDLRHSGQHSRRNDLLLHGTSGQNQLDREIFQGKERESEQEALKFLQGKGALMAFFTFLPAIGEVIAIALGFMRSNTWLTASSMFVGKLIRYILLLYALEGAWDAIAG